MTATDRDNTDRLLHPLDHNGVPSFFAANPIFEFIKSTKVGGSNSNTQSKAWIASITPNTIAWVSTILYRSLLGWIKGAPDRSQLEKSFTKEQHSAIYERQKSVWKGMGDKEGLARIEQLQIRLNQPLLIGYSKFNPYACCYDRHQTSSEPGETLTQKPLRNSTPDEELQTQSNGLHEADGHGPSLDGGFAPVIATWACYIAEYCSIRPLS